MSPAGCLQRNHHRAAAALGIGHTPDADARFYYRCVRTHIKKRAKNSNLQFKKMQQRREDGDRIKRQRKRVGATTIDRSPWCGGVWWCSESVVSVRTPRTYALFFDYALIALARTSAREERRRGDGGRDYRRDRERTAHFLEYTQMHQHTTTKKRTLPCSAMHILSLGFLECAQFSGCVVYVNMRTHIFCN